jgi:hypothetical protein
LGGVKKIREKKNGGRLGCIKKVREKRMAEE